MTVAEPEQTQDAHAIGHVRNALRGMRFGEVRIVVHDGVVVQVERSADEAHQVTVGVNWYLNAHVKLVLNYDRTSFDGGASNGDRHTEDLVVGRTQLVF